MWGASGTKGVDRPKKKIDRQVCQPPMPRRSSHRRTSRGRRRSGASRPRSSRTRRTSRSPVRRRRFRSGGYGNRLYVEEFNVMVQDLKKELLGRFGTVKDLSIDKFEFLLEKRNEALFNKLKKVYDNSPSGGATNPIEEMLDSLRSMDEVLEAGNPYDWGATNEEPSSEYTLAEVESAHHQRKRLVEKLFQLMQPFLQHVASM